MRRLPPTPPTTPEQPHLFHIPEGTRVSRRHPDTSRAAAEKAAGKTVSEMRRRILRLLADHPDGLTDEEMQTLLHMTGNSQRPARVGLEEWGLVERTKQRRPTRAGNDAIVWKITSEGAATQ